MHGFTIITIPPVGSDPRGETRELFKGLPGRQVTLYHRVAGAVFAEHFHKGLDPAKDPEYFFLISGTVEVEAYDARLGERVTARVEANQLVTIHKNIFHRFKALTDVVFLEYRTTVFDPNNNDCFLESEYQNYLDQLED